LLFCTDATITPARWRRLPNRNALRTFAWGLASWLGFVAIVNTPTSVYAALFGMIGLPFITATAYIAILTRTDWLLVGVIGMLYVVWKELHALHSHIVADTDVEDDPKLLGTRGTCGHSRPVPRANRATHQEKPLTLARRPTPLR
jgi:hypothetical protein